VRDAKDTSLAVVVKLISTEDAVARIESPGRFFRNHVGVRLVLVELDQVAAYNRGACSDHFEARENRHRIRLCCDNHRSRNTRPRRTHVRRGCDDANGVVLRICNKYRTHGIFKHTRRSVEGGNCTQTVCVFQSYPPPRRLSLRPSRTSCELRCSPCLLCTATPRHPRISVRDC
jgi:hypothetical protein